MRENYSGHHLLLSLKLVVKLVTEMSKVKKSSERGNSEDSDDNRIVVSEPRVESIRRKRVDSDDPDRTIVESMFPPVLNSLDPDDEQYDFMMPDRPDEAPTPIETIPRPRRIGGAILQRRPASAGITEDEYRRIIRGQVIIGDLRSSPVDEKGEDSAGSQGSSDNDTAPKRKETIIRRPALVNAASETLARAKKAAIEEILQSVPTVYKSNLRILSNTGKMVRMETDEMTFKLMMRDLQQRQDQHNYHQGSSGTLISGYRTLPNRKISTGQKFQKPGSSTLIRSVSHRLNQPERKIDYFNHQNARRQSDTQNPCFFTQRIKTAHEQPWVEIKLRQDDYSSLMSAITNEPKSSHLIQKHSFKMGFLDLKLTYHNISLRNPVNAPLKGRAEVSNYDVPLHEDLRDDVAFPIIIKHLPISFNKAGEHIRGLEKLYRMSLDKTFSEQQGVKTSEPYIVQFQDHLSEQFCNIPNNFTKSTPSTPSMSKDMPFEGNGSQSMKYSGVYKLNSLDAGNHEKISPRCRKRDRPKHTIEKIVNHANNSVKKISGSQ